MANRGRLHRVLRLLVLLQGRGGTGVTDLVEELQVSRRTLFRDLQMLQAAGIPCHHDKDDGYRIGKGDFLPPVSLTVPETLGVMLLAKSVASQRGAPLSGPALSAIGKLTAMVPDEIRGPCIDLMSKVSIGSTVQSYRDKESSHYLALQRYIDEGRCCRLAYRSPVETQVIRCRLEPYCLHFASRAWYVIGWTDRYRQTRIFKLNRIESLEPMRRLFIKPRRFKPSDKLGKAWQMIPEGKVYQVELLFTPKVATNVVETRWHPTQRHEFLSDGSCRMWFEVDGVGEIAWWVCGYADQVEVIQPLKLRETVRKMLAAAAGRYSDDKRTDLSPAAKEPSTDLAIRHSGDGSPELEPSASRPEP